MLRLGETRLNRTHRQKRPDHQPGTDEQYQRERDFCNDKSVARPMAFAAGGQRPTGITQGRGNVWSRIFGDRDQPEQETSVVREKA